MLCKNKNFKSAILRTFNFATILLLVGSVFVNGQTTGSTADRNSESEQVKNAEDRVNQITQDAGRFFKQGLYNLLDKRGSEARKDFDKSVEVFLMSGVNVQRNQKLNECYNQLIETVYRMEFPSKRKPADVRTLSTMCGWTIKNELADDVAELIQKNPDLTKSKNSLVNSSTTTAKNVDKNIPNGTQVGFSEQKFEPSPLDELSKLELTEEETNISTPEARIEYEVIRLAVEKNRSLGFRFQMHAKVQQFINYYRGRGRRTMEVGLYRSGLFMTMARQIFRQEGVPENIAWLGQVESAWKPTAHSWAAAAGLWQFIPGTGRRYGLRRTAYLDERQSFEKATRASARYLRFLANRYGGNWELAIGAYNCGEGNTDRAIRRAGVRNFWAAYPYLPRETRNYVPNILATIIIANNPYKYGFGHIRPARALRYDLVRVPPSTRLNLVAQASGTNVNYLRYLNPELRTNISPPEAYVIRVPLGKGIKVANIFRGRRVGRSRHLAIAKSSKGETWENLSRRTGVSVAELKKANPGMKYPTGKVILPIKTGGVKRTNYSRPVVPEGMIRVRLVKAKAGDTVEKIAKRYRVSPKEVAAYNGLLVTSKLKAGREVKIPMK